MTDDWRTKMKKLWTKGKTGAAAVLLACFLAALAASTSGRLARPEREDPGFSGDRSGLYLWAFSQSRAHWA